MQKCNVQHLNQQKGTCKRTSVLLPTELEIKCELIQLYVKWKQPCGGENLRQRQFSYLPRPLLHRHMFCYL